MARQLWMLRHGDAEPHGARADPDRRLTHNGQEQARLVGLAMARLGVEFVAIFTSPKVRAHATATGAAVALDEDVVVHAGLAEDFDVAEALMLLGAADDGEKVLVVGHDPDFTKMTYELTGARVNFKKVGISVIRIEGTERTGDLLALLRPAELAAIAGE
ncbi:MAG: phosphohistidine phosphatase [Solirubrobacterales bacterium]|nr:phosphohistidine phosphatase [Solirubrobacterales bacterium]